MKSDLDELIEFYEQEKLYIEKCIKENINEWEYLHAHYHSHALFIINNQLRTLNKLKDAFYDKRTELERMIEIYKEWDKSKRSNMDSYYQKMIDDNNHKLEELNKQKKQPIYDDQ